MLVQTRLPKKLAAKLKKEVKDRDMVSQAALVRQIIAERYADGEDD